MTKSQNTKNEQHCIKQNEKNFIQKDLSLTELWQKGKLPDGEDYYIKWKDSEVFIATFVDFMGKKMFQRMELEFEELPIEHYLSVLAPVPTFEEWQASEKYNKHLEEVIKVYERKDKQATETSIAYNKLSDENTKLKELLKRARDLIEQMSWCESFYAYNDDLDEEIDEVLK